MSFRVDLRDTKADPVAIRVAVNDDVTVLLRSHAAAGFEWQATADQSVSLTNRVSTTDGSPRPGVSNPVCYLIVPKLPGYYKVRFRLSRRGDRAATLLRTLILEVT
jgi:predicted secreted protein